MALDKEFLASVFEGIEKPEERIEKVLKEYEADVTGLKVNRDQVLSENKGHKEKAEKLTQEWTAKEAEYKKQLEELDKQIKSSGKDELKSYYEAELKKAQGVYQSQLEEVNKKATTVEAENARLFNEYIDILRNVEFEKAAEKINNLDQTKKAILRDVFFKRNDFEFKEVDGIKKFLNKGNYRDVNDSLQSFIGTDEGKFFLLANSTGGGAAGSGSKIPSTNNPYKKETFNLTEQMKLEREKPELADQLKSQAGVK
jgi:hypothetical protein